MGIRHQFGGGIADYAITTDSTLIATFAPGAAITAWNARTGGSQYLNLALDPAGVTLVTGVISSDGSDGNRPGYIPIFFGPEDVTTLYLSADGGPRVAVGTLDAADMAGSALTAVNQHVTAVNPHQTTFSALADVDFPSPIPTGAYPVWNQTTNQWEVATSGGLNPNSFVSVSGGSVVRIAEGNTTLVGQEWRAPSGGRDTAANLLQLAWNSGTTVAPVWSLGGYANGYGELRGRSPRDNGVAFRVERRSSGATGDLFQVVSESGTVLAYINSKGQIRAANLGRTVTFTAAGALGANPGKFVFYNDTSTDLVLRSVRFSLDTAGSTTSTFDVNVNNVTLYPTTKPSLGSGVKTVQSSTAFTVAAGQYVTVDVDAAGTGAANLTAQLELW